MIEFILLMVAVLAYVGTGLNYARSRYATLSFERKSALPTPTEQEKANLTRIRILDENRAELLTGNAYKVVHSLGCEGLTFTSPQYRQQWCNCGVYRKLEEIERERRELKMGTASIQTYVEPEKFKPFIFWPAYMMGSIITSGTPADTEAVRRAKEIAEATHAADMAEIRARESAALDRELAASKALSS